MICPNCGAKVKGNYCYECDTDLKKKSRRNSEGNNTSKKDVFDECLKPDSTADSILKWANSCRSWGIGLSIFYAFIGLISGIISSSAALDIGMSGFSAFISEFLPAIVISVFIYLGLSAISLLLTALAKIVQYTRQTAAFTELQTRKIFNKKSEVSIDVLDDFDEKTDDEMREEDEEDHINEVGGIVCPKCKQTIAADSEFCYYCGEMIE